MSEIALIGKKIGMTREFYKSGQLVPVTVLKMEKARVIQVINEDKRYSEEYHEADKRSIANRIKIHFTDGSSTDEIEVEYPIGHKRRREEGIPVLEQKFLKNLEISYDSEKCDEIYALCTDQKKLENTSVIEFQELLSKKENNF